MCTIPAQSPKPALGKDDSLISQLETEKSQFKTTVSTPCNFQFYPNRYIDLYISCASKQLSPYECWTANFQKKSRCE